MFAITYQASGSRDGLPCINIMTECCNCGQLYSGKLYKSTAEWQSLAKVARKGMPTCSVCGEKIFQKEAYSVWNIGKADASLKKQLRENISQFESEKCRTTVQKQLPKVKSLKDMKADNEIAQKIKSDMPSLKVYLQHLVDLEIWSRFLVESIVGIETENIAIKKWEVHKDAFEVQLAAKKRQEKEKRLLDNIEKLKKTFESTVWVEKVEEIKLSVPVVPTYLQENIPQKPAVPIMKQPGFFNKKTVLAENERVQQEYDKAYVKYEEELKELENIKKQNLYLREQYEEELRKYEENVKSENERIKLEKKRLEEEGAIRKQEAEKELNKQINEINEKINELKNITNNLEEENFIETVLKKEKDECLELLKVICEAKNKLLSINVIYPNYRDVFALSSFYEYFNSERCYLLEGPDGAYNLYEAERRSDAVSTFFCKLEDINKKQVVLYREANEMFKKLHSLTGSLKEAIKVITNKETESAKISEKFIEDAFEKYLAKNKKFKQEISCSVESALECLK